MPPLVLKALRIGAALILATTALAEPAPGISTVTRTPNQTLEIGLQIPEDHYALLYRSAAMATLGQPVAIADHSGGMTLLRDWLPTTRRGFLRVGLIDKAQPADTDNDGLSDLYELTRPVTHSVFNPAPAIDTRDGGTHMPDRSTYEQLAHRDNFPGAANIREVKFVIFDVNTDSPDLYFADSNEHQYHYHFARFATGRYNSGSLFNQHTYFNNNSRRNLAGSLIAHDNYLWPDGREGIYTFEFWPTDPVAHPFVQTAFEMISASAPFFDGKLAYHPASETQRAVYRSESAEYKASQIPVIQTEELFGNQTYNALLPGTSFGRLKIATPGETLTARDIVIFVNIPNDITHLAGILTEVPQTPLSHINLKARQNNTPNAYLKDASIDPRLSALIGQNVRLEVGPDDFEIRAATTAEVDVYFESIRPSETQTPVRNLSATTIEDLDDLRFEDADAYGSKTSNLAELRTILPQITPDGWAIPFYFYDQFMIYNGYYAEAQTMMAEPDFIASAEVREQRLGEFRERIEDFGSMPFWMIDSLTQVQNDFPAATPMRARSSTNNEDLEGFNGAGLYESYTHHPDEGHLSKTAKQVWAGLWTYRAFEEREFWRIDHMHAAMGILIHPNFSDEIANGVGVTKNIYLPGPGWDGHYVNVQLGENLVTNPEPGTTPEEFVIADLDGDVGYEIQYIRFSNLVPEGETIFDRDQALELKDAMNITHNYFKQKYDGGADFAMELEFKLDEYGQLFVKQARPWID